MNFNDLISVFCSIAVAFGISAGTYKAYKFVRHEVIMQCQKGLPSLEKFSRELTKPK